MPDRLRLLAGRRRGLAAVLGLAALAAYSASALRLDPAAMQRGWRNLGMLWDLAVPPDLGALDVALVGMQETLHIAFLGTLLGTALSLPVALLASRNLFPGAVGVAARLLLAGVRVMPSLLWAILFVMLVGLGPMAGVLAVAWYTVGFLGKLQYEAIEGLARDPMEAMHAIGATRLQTVRHAVLPEAANALVSQVLFLFEYNVRASAVIGVVGAGGIGFYLMGYLRFFQYDKALVLLAVIFAVVVGLDAASRLLRRRYLDDGPAGAFAGTPPAGVEAARASGSAGRAARRLASRLRPG